VNWKYLSKSNEVLWFSERDNWGQMYLYDLTTGKLKNQITHGDGNVTQVLHVDEKARATIYFLAVGKERGRDPYFSHSTASTSMERTMKLLTPEDADHAVTLSPGRAALRRCGYRRRRSPRPLWFATTTASW
jgi:dipeptidyl-peptidase-4